MDEPKTTQDRIAVFVAQYGEAPDQMSRDFILSKFVAVINTGYVATIRADTKQRDEFVECLLNLAFLGTRQKGLVEALKEQADLAAKAAPLIENPAAPSFEFEAQQWKHLRDKHIEGLQRLLEKVS
jgi:hypothetical protein